MTIYLDVLILINFYVTYFQLLAVCIFTHSYVKAVRKAAAALIGAVSSLVIFIPQELTVITVFIKIGLCFLLTLIMFGYKSVASFLKYSVFLIGVNFLFAGLMLCVWLFAAPMSMFYSNGTVYFNIDFMTVVICTGAAYAVIRIIRLILDKNGKTDCTYTITVKNMGKTGILTALSDSANGMIDYFSGLPVIVCRKEACKDISPPGVNQLIYGSADICDTEFIKGVRILPYSTVSSDGFLYAFRADSITVSEPENHKEYNVNALIGIAPDSNQQYDAIFNPKLLV